MTIQSEFLTDNDFTNETEKTTPIDADVTLINDSADSNKVKKLSWANIKATLFSSPTFTTKITTPIVDLTGGQIAFPAVQASSGDINTLDDYEEGTWTPVPTGITVVGTPTYVGKYIKIGKCIQLILNFEATTSVAASSAYFTGFPFSVGLVYPGIQTNNALSWFLPSFYHTNNRLYLSDFSAYVSTVQVAVMMIQA